jgi:hypothetical protein
MRCTAGGRLAAEIGPGGPRPGGPRRHGRRAGSGGRALQGPRDPPRQFRIALPTKTGPIGALRRRPARPSVSRPARARAWGTRREPARGRRGLLRANGTATEPVACRVGARCSGCRGPLAEGGAERRAAGGPRSRGTRHRFRQWGVVQADPFARARAGRRCGVGGARALSPAMASVCGSGPALRHGLEAARGPRPTTGSFLPGPAPRLRLLEPGEAREGLAMAPCGGPARGGGLEGGRQGELGFSLGRCVIPARAAGGGDRGT